MSFEKLRSAWGCIEHNKTQRWKSLQPAAAGRLAADEAKSCSHFQATLSHYAKLDLRLERNRDTPLFVLKIKCIIDVKENCKKCQPRVGFRKDKHGWPEKALPSCIVFLSSFATDIRTGGIDTVAAFNTVFSKSFCHSIKIYPLLFNSQNRLVMFGNFDRYLKKISFERYILKALLFCKLTYEKFG